MQHQHKTTNFPDNLKGTDLQFSDFYRIECNPDEKDIQAGLTDQMIYQRIVDGYFVIHACGVWFKFRCYFLPIMFHMHSRIILIF
jgi:hypothetical protein